MVIEAANNNPTRMSTRVMFAFLVVPWIPIFFLIPYSMILGTFKSDAVWSFVGSTAVLAIITYVLEVVAVIPLWRSWMHSGKISLLRFLATGFALAFAISFVVVSLLTGLETLFDLKSAALVFLFGVIGAAEAISFWLIVRPDRLYAIQENQKLNPYSTTEV